MFALVLSQSKYLRVREGITAKDIERVLGIPLQGEVYAGLIIRLPERKYKIYLASVGESYEVIAQKLGVGINELKKINGNKNIYPFCKVYY
jgi:hypothetical protein